MVYKLTSYIIMWLNNYNTYMSAFYTDCYKILEKDDFVAWNKFKKTW
jgi:hypothetical protein